MEVDLYLAQYSLEGTSWITLSQYPGGKPIGYKYDEAKEALEAHRQHWLTRGLVPVDYKYRIVRAIIPCEVVDC